MPEHFDPEAAMIEAAIDDTKEFLATFVLSDQWHEESLEPQVQAIFSALVYLEKIEKAPAWVIDAIGPALEKAMQKRTHKRTYQARELFIATAAMRLTPRYKLTRNEATRGAVSASDIVHKALARMGIELSVRRVSDIASKHQEFARDTLAD